MKLSFTLLFSIFLVTACGGDSSPSDSGVDGSPTNDATTNDVAVNDSPSDGPTTDAHPKADAGDTCDLIADNCGPGLKCCTGGAVQPDAGVGHCIVPTDAGTCPPVP